MQHLVSINKIFSILLIILHLLILFYYSKFDISVQFLCEITYRKSSIKPPLGDLFISSPFKGGGAYLIQKRRWHQFSIKTQDAECKSSCTRKLEVMQARMKNQHNPNFQCSEIVNESVVISSLNTKFFQIWSSVTGYGELNVCFQPIRIGEIF